MSLTAGSPAAVLLPDAQALSVRGHSRGRRAPPFRPQTSSALRNDYPTSCPTHTRRPPAPAARPARPTSNPRPPLTPGPATSPSSSSSPSPSPSSSCSSSPAASHATRSITTTTTPSSSISSRPTASLSPPATARAVTAAAIAHPTSTTPFSPPPPPPRRRYPHPHHAAVGSPAATPLNPYRSGMRHWSGIGPYHLQPQHWSYTAAAWFWYPAARCQWSPLARSRLVQALSKSSAGGSGGGASGGNLQVGAVVVFEKNNRNVLGRVAAPDGKKNWWVVDQSGRKQSVNPKSIELVLPNGTPGGETDLAALMAAADSADMSMLELAWEIACEEVTAGAALDLTALSSMLFNSTSPTYIYATFSMITRDPIFFRQVSRVHPPAFTPRSRTEVVALQRQVEAEAAARAEAEDWRAAVAAARGARSRAALPRPEDWAAGPYKQRIAALKAAALAPYNTDEATLALALSSMQLVGPTGGSTSLPTSGPSWGVSGALGASQGAGGESRPDQDAAVELLKELGVFRLHEPVALLRRGIALAAVEEEERVAQALLAAPPPDPDADDRMDLTHLTVFTIDSADTTEIDDGLSIENLHGNGAAGDSVGDGSVRIWIHVADPTRWISPGSALDLAGRQRQRTLYLPWGSVPMFPRALAEGPFSLREGCVCDALSVGLVLEADGSLRSPCIVTPSRVRVSHKMAYDMADRILAGTEDGQKGGTVLATPDGAEGDVVKQEGPAAEGDVKTDPVYDKCDADAVRQLRALQRVAIQHNTYRQSRGCIEIPLPEAEVRVPEDHLDRVRPAVSVTCLDQWSSAARQMVAEWMIAAGEAVGALGSEAGLPLPYRSQDTPDLPPRSDLERLPPGPCRGFALKRCMTRSSMGPTPAPHASLALDAYVQVTSPIRRYTDFVAHHNLKAWLRGDALPYPGPAIGGLVAGGAEAAQRDVAMAERDVDNYWIAEYLRLNWGAEYPAIVLGWQREELQLASFLLEEQGLEVVVKVPPGSDWAPGDGAVLVASEAKPGGAGAGGGGTYRFYVAGWTSGVRAGGLGAGGDEEGEELGEGEVVELL